MAVHESWCPRCRVSHPPERKVCLHCGGRTEPHRDGAKIFDAQSAVESQMRRQGPAERSPFEPAPAPGPVDVSDEDAEPESRTARGARLGLTLVWIALAIGASLLRMCQEPG